jgi:hypothetical protein
MIGYLRLELARTLRDGRYVVLAIGVRTCALGREQMRIGLLLRARIASRWLWRGARSSSARQSAGRSASPPASGADFHGWLEVNTVP